MFSFKFREFLVIPWHLYGPAKSPAMYVEIQRNLSALQVLKRGSFSSHGDITQLVGRYWYSVRHTNGLDDKQEELTEASH